jgi:L-cystine uptake protein TcyP (sodium:dicarboxylate symporter family)
MGFPLESWDAAFADIGMFVGADGGAGWYTAIAVVMYIAIIVVGNNDEQEKYNKHK